MEDGEERKIGRLRPETGRQERQNGRPRTETGRQERQSGRPRTETGRKEGQSGSLEQRLAEWKKRRMRRALYVFLGFLGIVYAAAAIYFSMHFYEGTVIYGTDCSQMTLSQAKSQVAEKLGTYDLTLELREGKEDVISAEEIELKFEDDGDLDRLLRNQRAYLWPVMMFLAAGETESVSFTYNREEAKETLLQMDCFDVTNVVAPQNAYLGETPQGYEVVPEVMGTTLDQEKTVQCVLSALDAGSERISLEEEGCYRDPSVYRDDEALNQDAETLNELVRAHIAYDFGDRQEVVDASVMRDWIVENADGSFSLDEGKMGQYVESLAAKYDTFGCDREFYTSLGTVVSLSGGDYGWCIDQEATLRELIQGVKDGVTDTREPVYLYTAMSRDTDDIGYTYVEICISQQRMWCYEDGYLVVDTPVVTGNPNRGNATPAGGVWAIDAKMRDTILEGEGYESPVDYWMPFNGDVGIHDMQNRYHFGGTIYLSNGSHGCVNTPYEQAKKIYETVSIGSPVIVYD